MKRLILIRWDMKLGPQNIIQFPPEENFPAKEVLLKLWARHEMNQNSNFITLQDLDNDYFYCSLLKTHKPSNNTYLIILDLEPFSEIRTFQDILENVADEIISNLNSPQFTHILSESYRIIKTQSEMDENQLFFRLFEDRTRIEILKILRKGIITKTNLKEKLETRWGTTNLNLDLFLTPFLRLGLIKIMDIPGAQESICLSHDVYCCRFPPKINPKHDDLVNKMQSLLQKRSIFEEERIQSLMKLMQEPGVKELCSLLKEDIENGMPYDIGLTVVKQNQKILDDLEKFNLIYVEEKKVIYILTELQFFTFKPFYLIPNLINRYYNNEISFEQLISHIELFQGELPTFI